MVDPQLHSLILRQVNDAVIAIDNDARVTFINRAAERMYHVSARDAVGRPLNELYEYRWLTPADETHASESLSRHGFWRGENIHLRRDGTTVRVESAVSMMTSAEGTPAGLLAVIRDVSSTRRVEQMLRDRSERTRRVLSIDTVGVLFFSLDGRMQDANGAFERMSGYSADDLRRLDWRQLTPAEFLDVTRHAAGELRSTGETAPYEKQMVRKDGTRWWGLFAPKRIGGEGDASECVEFVLDITATKNGEERLRRNEARHAFLLRLDDRLRPLSNPGDMQYEAACALGEHLQVSRVGYGEDSGDDASIVVTRNYTDGVRGIEGRYRYHNYGATRLADFRAGRTVVRPDVLNDPTLDPEQREAHAALAIGAMVDVPILKQGRLVGVMFMHNRVARAWTDDEVRLLEAVAERTRDAVERARAEAALRQSEERYRTLFQSIDEGFGILQMIPDGDGRVVDYRFVEINDMFEVQTGLRGALGRTVREMAPGIEPRWMETYGHIATTGEARRFIDYAAPLKRWFDVYAFRVGNPDERKVAVLFTDITERRQAAERLHDLEAHQRMALDAAELGTWRHDVLTGEVELDARAGAFYGLTTPTTTIAELFARIHPDDASRLEVAQRAAFDPGLRGPIAAEYRAITPSGIRWLAVNGQVHFASTPEGDRATVGVGTIRDITAEKHRDDALREAERRKDEFLAILAHELRNPLAPIRTAVGVLRAPDIPPTLQVRAREIIDRQVAHMARLVDDLLDVSRLSRGTMSLQRGPVLLDDVLDAAIETARPVIEAHGHHLDVQRATVPLLLDGDLARLSQVFANLLNNAANYTPTIGHIAIRVEPHERFVDVHVIDSGQGIEPDQFERIFELFARAGTAPTPAAGGLGIGLALARQLVALHGGRLTVASDGRGRGATFSVHLPLCVSAEDIDAPAASQTTSARVAGRRVLVVDDNIDAADTSAMLLGASGCEVRAVYSGAEALEALGPMRPQIILLDIGMPGMDGFETCRRMRATPVGAAARIIAITGWGQEESRRRTQAAGFDAHVVKPVSPQALFELVEETPAGGTT